MAQITAFNKKHWWLDCGSRLDYDIEAIMVAVVPSWLSENSHHATGFNPWLVHIGRENVGTLVKSFIRSISPMHHHKIRQFLWQHASCHLQCLQWHLSHMKLQKVLLDWDFDQILQEYQIYKQVLLFELAACTIWKEVDAVNRRVLCVQASDYFG